VSADPREAWLQFLRGAAESLSGDNAPDWGVVINEWAQASGLGDAQRKTGAAAFAEPLEVLLEQCRQPTGGDGAAWLLSLSVGWIQQQLNFWQLLAALDPADPDSVVRLADFQAASNRCAAHYAACLQTAAANLEAQIAARDEDVERLREYFDLWVACFEAAHAELIGQTDFASDYAALVNAALALQLAAESRSAGG
jgi:hypothetical protein